MIKEDYCSYEVAKLLKERGFNEKCRGGYHSEFDDNDRPIVMLEEWMAQLYNNDFVDEGFLCSAPTHQMAMKWLRETHQLHISVDVCPIYGKVKDEKGRNTCGLLYWHYIASGEWLNEKRDPFKKAFVVSEKSHKQAVEAALKYSLENLI